MEFSHNKKLFTYIIIAYLFSLTVHLVWVYQFQGYEPFMWNGEFMINTNDGYNWAEGARDVYNGYHQKFDRSPVDAFISIFTAYLYKFLPFSFESIIFYMPAFLSSLVVIPLILIADNLKRIETGFLAALIGSIAWSYYNRTLVGYYDTDMLNIVLPTVLLWSLMLALRTQEEKYLLISALDIIVYRAWYPQSYSLEFAFFALLFVYMLWKRFKQNKDVAFELMLLAFMLLAMMGLNGWVRLGIVTLLYGSLKKGILTKEKFRYVFFVAVGMFFLTGGFSPIWYQLKGYVFRQSVSASEDELRLHFFSVMQTIREAGKIPFDVFANRISGHPLTFVLALTGYIWMSIRYPTMLLGLPMLGLGFLAYVGGLRFTIYAVPILALGIAFFITEIGKFFHNRVLRLVFVAAASVLVLLPNVTHAFNYLVPTVFVKDEVAVLDRLKTIANREDYVVSWWDYGHPIRYYSDVKTLIDGGKHNGDVNFPVSYILTKDQRIGAKLARLDVEYTEDRYRKIDSKEIKEDSLEYKRSNIAQMMLDNGFKDPENFFEALALENTVKIPKKTRDVYLYLPKRMIDIYPTVSRFSDIDLKTGKTLHQPLFLATTPIGKKEGKIFLRFQRYRFVLDLAAAEVSVGAKRLKIQKFVATWYDDNQRLHTQEQTLRNDADTVVVYMKSYNMLLIMDAKTYDSTYIRLFVLERYDKDLYEAVILSPYAKVYKLKL